MSAQVYPQTKTRRTERHHQEPCEARILGRIRLLRKTHYRNSSRCVWNVSSWASWRFTLALRFLHVIRFNRRWEQELALRGAHQIEQFGKANSSHDRGAMESIFGVVRLLVLQSHKADIQMAYDGVKPS